MPKWHILQGLIWCKQLVQQWYWCQNLNGTEISCIWDLCKWLSWLFSNGQTHGKKCARHVAKGICKSAALHSKYLHSMTPADAWMLSVLHHRVHGVPGMAGSFVCTCFPWAGKSKKLMVVLEGASDYNFWFWHASGYTGALNDINVWDSSPLHRSMVDGSFSANDFSYEINGKEFRFLWYLVDGIYPCLNRFVKTISEPVNRWEVLFTKW